MEILYLFPIIILYIIMTMYLAGLLFVSIYSRYAKKKSKVRENFQSDTEKTMSSDTGKKSRKVQFIHGMKAKLNLYLYGLCRYYSVLIGRVPSQRIRNLLVRKCLCMDISPKTVLYGGFEIRSPWNIHIGESVIGVGALLDGRCGINIGDRVCLAQNVKMFTMQHDVNAPQFMAVGGGV